MLSVLLHMQGANNGTSFPDGSGFRHTLTAVGNAKTSTVNTGPFASGSSMRLDGTGDYLTAPRHHSLQLEGGQFTVQGFINLDSAAAGADKVFCGIWGWSQLSWLFGLRPSRKIFFYWSLNGSSGVFTPESTNVVALSTWTHVAATRDGSNNLRLFVGGVKGYDAVHSATYFTTTTTGFSVGGQFGGGGELPASYLAEWSVRKGECLYTADFTPPSVEESDEAPYASAVAIRAFQDPSFVSK